LNCYAIGGSINKFRKLRLLSVSWTVFLLASGGLVSPARALLPEPPHVIHGEVIGDGLPLTDGTLALKLPATGEIVATSRLGSNPGWPSRFSFQVPLDAREPREQGRAMSGDPAEIILGGETVAQVTIGERGTFQRVDLDLILTHEIRLTTPPAGSPNPVLSAGGVLLTVAASDTRGHALSFLWTASCPGGRQGAFADPGLPDTLWTAPVAPGPWADICVLTVSIADGHGLAISRALELTVMPYPVEPVAVADAAPLAAFCGQGITFDGSGSFHPNPLRQVALWEWDFAYDGATFRPSASGRTRSHAYQTLGSHQVALRVTDDNPSPKTDLDTVTVTVVDRAPTAEAGGPYRAEVDRGVTLDGRGSQDPDGSCGDAVVSYAWDLDGDGVWDDAAGALVTLSWEQLETLVCKGACQSGQEHLLSLRVADAQGAADTDTATLKILSTGGPVANFTAVPNRPSCNQTITFNGSSSYHTLPGTRRIVSYQWDFDYDGAEFQVEASGVTASRAFPLLGPHRVALRVTDDAVPPRVDVASAMLTVANRPPLPEAGGPYVFDAGQGVVLDARGSQDQDAPCGDSVASYAWDLDGDGAWDLGGETAALSWAQVSALVCQGTCVGGRDYSVTLQATDGHGAAATDRAQLVINHGRPVAVFSREPAEAACGETVTFDGSASYHTLPAVYHPTTYQWDFDYDGAVIQVQASGATATHAYTSFGSHTAALWLADDNPHPATDLTTSVVSVRNRPPVAHAGGPYRLTAGEGLTLDGSLSSDADAPCGDAVAAWTWDLNSDGTYGEAEGVHPTLGWDQVRSLICRGDCLPGVTYHFWLKVQDGQGGAATALADLAVDHGRPVAVASFLPAQGNCGQEFVHDGSASYHTLPGMHRVVRHQWDFDHDGVTFRADAEGAVVSHAYAALGGHLTALRVSDDASPPATATTTVTVTVANRPPTAIPGGPYLVEYGNDLSLDGSGSSDPDAPCGDSLAGFAWDLDGDGEYDDAAGARPEVGWAQVVGVVCDGRCVPDRLYPVGLRVTDLAGQTGEGAATLDVSFVLFQDDFSHGNRIGDPDWQEMSGDWSVQGAPNPAYVSVQTKSSSAVVRWPELAALSAMGLECRLKLSAGRTTPNGWILFAYQSGKRYRYLKFTGGKPPRAILGQAGTMGGEKSGIKVNRRLASLKTGVWHTAWVDVHDDGWVRVYVNGRGKAALSFKFKQAPAGKVGVRADKTRTLVDDFVIRHEEVLP
jgi:PKD repeat protein